MLIIRVNNLAYIVTGLIDTGADRCLLPTSHQIMLKTIPSGPKEILRGIGGSGGLEVFPHKLRLQLMSADGKKVIWDTGIIPIHCAVNNNDIPLILGSTDFLRHLDISFNYSTSSIIIHV